MSTDRVVKIGIMSFAHMHAHGYAACLKEHPGIEFVGIADDEPARAKEMAKRYGVKAFATYEDMLATDVDAVIVTSENANHRRHRGHCRAEREARDVREAAFHDKAGRGGHRRGLQAQRGQADDGIPVPLPSRVQAAEGDRGIGRPRQAARDQGHEPGPVSGRLVHRQEALRRRGGDRPHRPPRGPDAVHTGRRTRARLRRDRQPHVRQRLRRHRHHLRGLHQRRLRDDRFELVAAEELPVSGAM